MNCKISYTPIFEKSLKRLSKHYKSLKDDFRLFLQSINENPLQGSDLGGGIYKIRMRIASKGKGKSGGARVITFKIFQQSNDIEILLLDIYDKSECDTLNDKEIKELIKKSGLS